MACINNPRVWEVEAGRSGLKDYPQIYSAFEVNLDYMRPYLDTQTAKPLTHIQIKDNSLLLLFYSILFLR